MSGPTVAPHRAAGLADELMEVILDSEPMIATVLGFPGRDHLLAELDADAQAQTARRMRSIGDQARALDLDGATPSERLTADLVAQSADSEADLLDTRRVDYTLSPLWGSPLAGLLTFAPMVTMTTPEQGDAYLVRLAAVPAYLQQAATRLAAGTAAGRTVVAPLADAALTSGRQWVDGTLPDPLTTPEPDGWDGEVRFEADRARLLAEVVRPAVTAYLDRVEREARPAARPAERPGLCHLPGGESDYAALVRYHTTTELSPQQIHDIGHEAVAALAEEYAELGGRVLGERDVRTIFRRLSEDQEFRYRDVEDMLEVARSAIDRAQAAAPQWFGRLPEGACALQPVPEGEAPTAPAAYYSPPSLDGARPGTFWINTYAPTTRTRFDAEATAFHEAVPGHHFQIALAQQIEGLPRLQQVIGATAYGEGWGLYTERLAREMGLYSDDTSLLGMLSADSMRACRLVVDTGMHALAWSRQQAIDYMRANSPMDEGEIVREIDRYIDDPGQALAYLVGRREIQRMRADAERTLGDRFDIRSFHDVVLGSGSLPLGLLDRQVTSWVRATA